MWEKNSTKSPGEGFQTRLDGPVAQADARQAAALREKLPQLTNRVDDHEQRITNNEEWVESINAFRRQVNQRLNDRSQPAYEAPQLQ